MMRDVGSRVAGIPPSFRHNTSDHQLKAVINTTAKENALLELRGVGRAAARGREKKELITLCSGYMLRGGVDDQLHKSVQERENLVQRQRVDSGHGSPDFTPHGAHGLRKPKPLAPDAIGDKPSGKSTGRSTWSRVRPGAADAGGPRSRSKGTNWAKGAVLLRLGPRWEKRLTRSERMVPTCRGAMLVNVAELSQEEETRVCERHSRV